MWKLISAMQLEELLKEKKPILLLDLREREDYEKSHIEEAVNLPAKDMEHWRLDHWKADIRIVCICYHGPNSIRAAVLLDRAGNEVSAVCGGMEAWNHRKKMQ